MRRVLGCAITLGLLCAGSLGARQEPTQQTQRFSTSTTAISVDVVVRDKHGKPVFGLTKDDFELLEDDISQQVDSFIAPKPLAADSRLRVATHNGEAPAPAPASRSTTDASLIAFVFGRLSGQGRNLATKAAEAYLKSRIDP